MNFEQAFYTWGENQLSRYKRGLGVCATSNMNSNFLDNCLVLGSAFQSETSDRTAEFTLYSPEFGSFVGVGISPREGGGDGRVNKLCHFFIPKEQQNIEEPENYIINYPYIREIKDGKILDMAEIEPALYDYNEIINKYGLKGKKLALLLYSIYPCMFGEVSNLAFIIDKSEYSEDMYSQIARDITWLLSNLVPEQGEKSEVYRKRLSYGVYTTKNIEAVTFIFTDNTLLCHNNFYLNGNEQSYCDIDIPEIYYTMAEYAEISKEAFFEFMDEILSNQYNQKLQLNDLSMLYYFWKLKKGKEVSLYDLKEEINTLLNKAEKSKWNREFIIMFLKQVKSLDNSEIVNFWTRFIIPQMKVYDNMGDYDKNSIDEATAHLICAMFDENRNNYKKFLLNLNATQRKKILNLIYSEPCSCVEREIESINTVKDFFDCVELYSLLDENERFANCIIDKAKTFYENETGSVRKSITDTMIKSNVFKKIWLDWITEKIDSFSTVESYIDYIKNEIDRIEISFAQKYYYKLLQLAKEIYVSDDEKEKSVIFYEESIRRMYSRGLSRDTVESFKILKKEWDIRKTIGRLIEENLYQLVERTPSTLNYRKCREKWIDCICDRLENEEDVSEHIYQKLLNNMVDIVNMTSDNSEEYIDKSIVSKYEDALWMAAGKKDRKTCLEWRMVFQMYQLSKNKYIKLKMFWQDINIFDDMDIIDSIVSSRNDLKDISNKISYIDEPEQCYLNRNLYKIWKGIKEDNIISKKSFMFLDNKICQRYFSQIKCFLQKQQTEILERQYNSDCKYAVINYLYLQQFMEEKKFVEEKNIRKRFKEYRKIIENNKSFIDVVLNTNYNLYDDWIKKRGNEIKLFFNMVSYPEVTFENIKETKQFLRKIRDVFGKDDVPEIDNIVKGYDNVMAQIEDEFSNIDFQIKENKKYIDAIDDEINYKMEQINDLKKEIENLNNERIKYNKNIESLSNRKTKIKNDIDDTPYWSSRSYEHNLDIENNKKVYEHNDIKHEHIDKIEKIERPMHHKEEFKKPDFDIKPKNQNITDRMPNVLNMADYE